MSLPPDQNRTPSHPPPWGIPASIAWLLLAFLLSLIVATVAYGVSQGGSVPQRTSNYDGAMIAIGALASIPVQVAVLAVAAHLRGWSPAEYLAINMPKRGEIIFATICVLAIDVVFDLSLYVTGRDLVPPFQSEAYLSAKDAGWLAAMSFAIVVVAPIGEEVGFRGFLYRGLVRPGWEIVAIIAISLAWALLHVQYDWLGMLQIFVLGLVLGWFRWASGSTTLTIIMHVLINLEATIETTIKVEWLS
jgi:membrane protease YdiL (CAAX protease family)